MTFKYFNELKYNVNEVQHSLLVFYDQERLKQCIIKI